MHSSKSDSNLRADVMTAQTEYHDHGLYDTSEISLYTIEHGTGADKGKGRLRDPASDEDARTARLHADVLMAQRLQEELNHLYERMGTSHEDHPVAGPSH